VFAALFHLSFVTYSLKGASTRWISGLRYGIWANLLQAKFICLELLPFCEDQIELKIMRFSRCEENIKFIDFALTSSRIFLICIFRYTYSLTTFFARLFKQFYLTVKTF